LVPGLSPAWRARANYLLIQSARLDLAGAEALVHVTLENIAMLHFHNKVACPKGGKFSQTVTGI